MYTWLALLMLTASPSPAEPLVLEQPAALDLFAENGGVIPKCAVGGPACSSGCFVPPPELYACYVAGTQSEPPVYGTCANPSCPNPDRCPTGFCVL